MTFDELQALMQAQRAEGALLDQARSAAVDYLNGQTDQPAFPGAQAVAGLSALDGVLPDGVSDPSAVLSRLTQAGAPATTSLGGGRYFGFVNGGLLPVALAARWTADVWDQNAALGVMSPMAARVEEIAQRWLVDLLGLPPQTVAGYVPGSSTAIFCGLAAGRWRQLTRANWDVNAKGMVGAPTLRIVTGADTHAAVLKALVLLGFGTDCIEYIPCDEQGRIIADKCPNLDARTILILQAGYVNSGAFDPFAPLIAKAAEAGAWVHVDGAFGLWAAASPALAHLTDGMAGAHSFSVDGHKTLNLPYDSGMVLCTDPEALTAAMRADGAYLVRDGARDGMAFTPEMSRRARAVELWAALAWLGRDGAAVLIDGLCARAQMLADRMQAAGFLVLNDVVFNQVLISAGDDAETAATLAAFQQSGVCWAGGSVWKGRKVIRFSVCSWATTEADIDMAVAELSKARNG
ncbi:MAG: pyridoxal-dependent decarboxylase [Pseudomonadota bacterium]